MTSPTPSVEWTFLSNHTHVLHCIYLWPEIRIRDIAAKVKITERAVQRIVVDLERGGYLTRERVGRQNHYLVRPRLHLRHELEHHVEVGRLLAALQPSSSTLKAKSRGSRDLANGPSSDGKVGELSQSRAGTKAGSRVRKRPARSRRRIVK